MTNYSFKIFTRQKRRGLAYYLYLPLPSKPAGQQRARTQPLLGYDLTEAQAYDLAIAKIKAIRRAATSGLPGMRRPHRPGPHRLKDGVTLYCEILTIQDRVDMARPTGIIENHLLPFFGSYPLAALTPEMGLRYVAGRKKAGAAIGTLRREWSVFTRILNLCVDAGWLPKNPMRLVTRNLPQAVQRKRVVTSEELALLEQHCLPALWRAVLVALHTGLRESKLLAIEDTWLRVEEEGYALLLPEARTRHKGNPLKIPLNHHALRALFPSLGTMPRGRIFTRWVRGNSLRVAWARVTARIGIQDLHFHDLRHTFATRLQNAGVDYEVRQHLLGHKMQGETATYSHGGKGWEAKLREAVTRLERYEVDAGVDASMSARRARHL
jgi:integrase